jgi:hypothetical protein
LKIIKISKYLGQGKDNHTWGHSSLYQRFFRILEVKIEEENQYCILGSGAKLEEDVVCELVISSE